MAPPPELARRSTQVPSSATLDVFDQVDAMRAVGVDVITLADGDPDFATPQHIVDAAWEAIRRGETHYVASAGIPPLRAALAEKLHADNGLSYSPDEVLVTSGAKVALHAAFVALSDPGAEALLLEPAWVSYRPLLQLAGLRPVSVALPSDGGFRISEDELARHVTQRTQLMVLNSPNNPTGRVYDGRELEAIASFAIRHNLWLVSDEIYEKVLFDGHEHVSPASFPGMRERTIVVNGFSKAYAMTGWRLGYAAGPRAAIAAMTRIVQHTLGCSAGFVQRAGLAALTGPQHLFAQMVSTYCARRDLVVRVLNALPGIVCHPSQGSLYLFADVSGTGLSSESFCARVLQEAQVALMPGTAFGGAGGRFVRLSLTCPDDRLHQAMARLTEALGREAGAHK